MAEIGPANEDDRKSLWEQVTQDLNQGLPESAIEKLKRINAAATADGEYPEATLALCRQFLLEGQKNQPVVPYVIKQLEAAIPAAPEPMRPILKTVLAEWFFNYFQQNRWRFQQRSQTDSPPSDEFETWDLATILEAIDQRFTEALESADALKKISVGDYAPLIEAGNVDNAHRPTMYDFIAFKALEFYSLDEQFIRQQGAFEISADSPIFSSRDEFLNWEPATDDDDSYLLAAVRLYQELLRFHQPDDDQTALLDTDLGRLVFGHSVANGSEATARYRAAMQRFADQNLTHPLSSSALWHLGSSFRVDEENVKALEIASQGQQRFPQSYGGIKCRDLVGEIKSKSSQLATERLWSQSPRSIDIHYRNVDQAWFRMYEFDFQNWKDWGNRPVINGLGNDELDEFMKKTSIAAAWSANLPKTEDYKQRTEAVSVPESVKLRSGCYIIVCSHNADFTRNNNAISVADVWVSQLSVVMKQNSSADKIEGWIVDADSGEPIGDVKIAKAIWKYDGRNSREMGTVAGRSNADGMFKLPHENGHWSKLYFTHGDQKYGLVDHLNAYRNGIRGYFESAVYFTDRSIYRPGQTIQFKGVCVGSDQQKNDYKTLIGRKITVVLYDANNQEVEKRTFTSNEFGSFSGSFTAPRDRVTGTMRIQSQGTSGSTNIRVEEYKRPKFFVEIDKPQSAFQLDQTVKISGGATAYTGAPIDGSKVVWRVVRNVRYPYWYRMRCWYLPLSDNSAEISNGETETNAEGKFEIKFLAEPDRSVERDSDPVFEYTIYADITDSAGETRSASQTTRIGYQALEATIATNDWQTVNEPVELKLSVTTLDGEGQKSDGKLTVYRLTPPTEIVRAELAGPRYWSNGSENREPDLSKINAWPTGKTAHSQDLSVDGEGNAKTSIKLPAGAFKAVFETTDASGQKVVAELPIIVVDPAADNFSVAVPNFFQPKAASFEPGEEFVAIWGTGYESGRALIEFEHRGEVIKSDWTQPGATQFTIKFPIEEKHRGGVQLRVTYVRENRLYSETRSIQVPWSNKQLTVKWEHFVSKLTPGGKETWTAIVKGPDAENVVAEFVAGMYDASLDAFAPHHWPNSFNLFYRDYSSTSLKFYNEIQYFNVNSNGFGYSGNHPSLTYPHFNPALGIGHRMMLADSYRQSLGRNRFSRSQRGVSALAYEDELMDDGLVTESASPAPMMAKSATASRAVGQDKAEGEAGTLSPPDIDLTQVSARTNLQETAFFFPNLTVDADGHVRIEFEVPEALTKWKFIGFAHDNELRSALLTDEMTTSKDLMVQPNPPRFLREGDQLEFSVKVTNQSDAVQTGTVRLTLADARTGESVDRTFKNEQLDRAFEIPAKQSKSFFWKINVPDFVGVLTYKAVGATEKVADGEEGLLPVLSKRILVTESLPLPIRGNQTKHFDFERLKNSGKSDTLKSQNLTVQMTSNPAWYAVMSLPYLMEYPHECSEQVFNRIYANAIGQHIVNSDPKIARVFEQWRNTPVLDSPLEKNEDLRNVLIAESPWLLAGKKESQARRDVGVLFEKNRLVAEQQRSLKKLAEMQLSDGAWPWFPGGPANDYITLYVTTGFGRMRLLGIEIDMTVALTAIDRLDWSIDQHYQQLKRLGHLDRNNLSHRECLYLYGRSFFLKDRAINDQYRESFEYFVEQAKQYWVKLSNRQSQGHVAIGLNRIGDEQTPKAIMKSLTERSLEDDEMGMFWREGESSWWWYHAPIETQALMIEAYDEVAHDVEKVEELKIWLLKQKQTQNWKTTKATADACYSLLLRGTDLLASDQLVSVKLGGVEVEPEAVEAGTGFYEQKFVRGEIKPEMGNIEVTKSDAGVAWGSVHWQYLEDVSKIEPYEGTPLTLKKSLYTKKNTPQGPVIEPVSGPVNVGDELVMRVELRVDRDMEYVHLKDYRGSGTEPVSVLSRYKFQDGLSYYESTKDTATHFFIDYLRRGTYVFEYSVRVQHRGVYETGIAELQCMYAPEFNSHSGSVEMTVE